MIKYFAALFCGCLLTTAFAPFHASLLAPLSLLGLLLLIDATTPRQAFRLGACFGLGFFASSISWIFISIHRYGNTNVPLAGLFTGAFVAVLALFPAIQCYLLQRFAPRPSILKYCLYFPASWSACELIRSTLYTGFPWMLTGVSQIHTPLAGWFTVIGIEGVSLLIPFISGVMLALYRGILLARVGISIIGIIALCGFGMQQLPWTHPITPAITVTALQGNIPQSLKWDENNITATLNTYIELMQKAPPSDLIVWPEAAIPLPFSLAQPLLKKLERWGHRYNTAIITGVPIEASNGKDYYNAAIVKGEGTGTYYKQHLVPFGEYVPLEKWLRGLIAFFDIPMSNFLPGRDGQALLRARNWYIAPFVCYEIAYNETVRRTLPQAHLLATVSNDAWFGDSIALAQHLQIAQAQAAQAQRDSIFVSNSGPTATINYQGDITAQTNNFHTTSLTHSLTPRQGQTLWVTLGRYPLFVVYVIAVLRLVRQRSE